MSKATLPYPINRRSVVLMAWVHARMAAAESGGSPTLYLAEALRQSWSEEKAEIARKAVKVARWERQSALAQQLDLLAQERLELLAMAGRTVPYSRGFREIRTGRVQGGRW
jgi:hypothetical protein